MADQEKRNLPHGACRMSAATTFVKITVGCMHSLIECDFVPPWIRLTSILVIGCAAYGLPIRLQKDTSPTLFDLLLTPPIAYTLE